MMCIHLPIKKKYDVEEDDEHGGYLGDLQEKIREVQKQMDELQAEYMHLTGQEYRWFR